MDPPYPEPAAATRVTAPVLPVDGTIGRVRVGVLRRGAVIAAAVGAAVVGAGCVGGHLLGANPGDGGCGFRPDGLVVDDITGVWEGDGHRFTLKLDGTITGRAFLQPPSPQPSASTRSSRPARPSPGAGRPSPGTAAPSPGDSPVTVEATGRWTLKAETYLGDIDITEVRSARGPASFGLGGLGLYVSGTRRAPWLYTFGAGDPDSCTIIRYERTSRG